MSVAMASLTVYLQHHHGTDYRILGAPPAPPGAPPPPNSEPIRFCSMSAPPPPAPLGGWLRNTAVEMCMRACNRER